MSVDNVGFLLDRLGQDCAPLQHLRELTQNSIEAITRSERPGRIVWDVDWITYDLTKLRKLCIIDTGDGMTGDEMLKFINQLSSSGSEQTFSSNYGLGAKISAATKNHSGVVYQSWKNGRGNMIHLERDEITGAYGLRQWELSDGTFAHVLPLEDDVKPEQISTSGTKVILFGNEETEDTMVSPDSAKAPSRWVSKYLNTRYFVFPDGVEIKAREGWDNPREDSDRNVLRTLIGQKSYLDMYSVSSGCEDIVGAKVWWWILKEEPAVSNNSGFIESAGHVAALYQDELYDRHTGRSGTARLQSFGILFGSRFVVLYVEPSGERGVNLTTNTARTTLLLNEEPLPWADWAYEFREKMPEELRQFVTDKSSSSTEKDHVKSIKDRLKGIMDLYKVSRYKPTPQGVYLADENSSVSSGLTSGAGGGGGSAAGTGTGKSLGNSNRGNRDGELGNIYHLFEKKDGSEAKKIETDPFPKVRWISQKDDTRTPDDLEDMAAKYLADQNTLLINADFRVFQDMARKLGKEKDGVLGTNTQTMVEDIVRMWFEQSLVESVIGIQQLKGSKEWTPKVIDEALSEAALTTAVMQRYHVHIACRRDLGAKLGKAFLDDEH